MSYAKRRGHSHDAEDFAQECVLYAFEHSTDAVFIARRFSDYVRKHYGRAGTPNGDARLLGLKHHEAYCDETHGFEPPDRSDAQRVGVYLARLSRYERLIYGLHHKYEVTLAQIGDCRGVSESRISQELSRIQKIIDQAVAREVSGVSRVREKEVERVLEAQRQRVERGEDIGLASFESFSVESFDATGL
jgi:DNA-directed RNA polymerase specialized sigma24 family protein